jgi:hypothetical protein
MSIEEQKIRERIRAGNEVAPGSEAERRPKIGRPLGTELERRLRQGVAKREPGGVQRLARSGSFQSVG